jgi:alpha-1,6-mannosyltransferase
MHIADITMFYAPESGGVKRYLHAKRAWLARRSGFRHTLLVPGARSLGQTAGMVALPGMPLPGSGGYRLPLATWGAARALRRLRPDVIEAGDPYFYAHAALQAGLDLGVPVIAFCHSDVPGLARRWLFSAGAGAVAAYMRWLYSRFDLVLAASKAVEASLRALGLSNVTRQPLGVDTNVFHPRLRDPALRQQLGIARDTRLLAFAGRYSPEKNLWVLEQAMRRLGPRFVLLTIGSGSHPARGANIVNLPYQSDPAALARLLASCDALVHPGDQETFGLVVLEAMACGLPVVGVDAGGVSELIDHGVGVKVPPLQPDALYQAICELFQRDCSALSRNARAHAVNGYDWNAVMPGLIAHYHGARVARAERATQDDPLGQLGKL